MKVMTRPPTQKEKPSATSELEPIFGEEKERIIEGYKKFYGTSGAATQVWNGALFYLIEEDPTGYNEMRHYVLYSNDDLYRVTDILKDWLWLTGHKVR